MKDFGECLPFDVALRRIARDFSEFEVSSNRELESSVSVSILKGESRDSIRNRYNRVEAPNSLRTFS